nr:hypothetical protein [Tanacetum cinerariifolium]
MAIYVIFISSDTSEESVGTSTARVILIGTISVDILATVPTIDPPIVHDNTPLIPTETPTIPPITPTIPYIFLSCTLIHLKLTFLIDHHHKTHMRLLLLGGGAE